jgi:hypothetical protein
MTEIDTGECVKLTQDLPELGLHCGDTGVVCSKWSHPSTAFEVEFQPDIPGCSIRALVIRNQIQKESPRVEARD